MVRNITILGGDYTVACPPEANEKEAQEAVKVVLHLAKPPSRMSSSSPFDLSILTSRPDAINDAIFQQAQRQLTVAQQRTPKRKAKVFRKSASKRALGAFFPFFITNILPAQTYPIPSRPRPSLEEVIAQISEPPLIYNPSRSRPHQRFPRATYKNKEKRKNWFEIKGEEGSPIAIGRRHFQLPPSFFVRKIKSGKIRSNSLYS